MNVLFFSFNAVMPIILIICLGYIIKRTGLLGESFFSQANKFVFNAALPIYLFYSVYNIDALSAINWRLITAACALVIFSALLAGVFFVFYTKDSGKRAVLIQCAFRSNFAIIGLPLARAIGGDEALATAAVISAVGIPVFNVLAVIVLSVYSYDNKKGSISPLGIVKSICKNPLIIGVVSALVCVWLRGFVPFTIKEDLPFLYKAIENVGLMASPLALVVQGGKFELNAVKELARDITLGVAWRLVITPALCLSLIMAAANMGLLPLGSSDFPALIAFYGSPVAVSSAIMAESMNCHGRLAGQLVIWCNVASIFTVFGIIVVFRGLGLV